MEIKIYIANLGKYNEGFLVGDWFTLPITDWAEVVEKIGLNEQYEEWAIHDYEAPFEISEYDSIQRLNEIAAALAEINEDEDVIRALFSRLKRDEALEKLRSGEYRVYHDCDDMGDVAYQIYEESGQLAEIEKIISSSYINWDAVGRDMEIEGTFIYLGDRRYLEIIN